MTERYLCVGIKLNISGRCFLLHIFAKIAKLYKMSIYRVKLYLIKYRYNIRDELNMIVCIKSDK